MICCYRIQHNNFDLAYRNVIWNTQVILRMFVSLFVYIKNITWVHLTCIFALSLLPLESSSYVNQLLPLCKEPMKYHIMGLPLNFVQSMMKWYHFTRYPPAVAWVIAMTQLCMVVHIIEELWTLETSRKRGLWRWFLLQKRGTSIMNTRKQKFAFKGAPWVQGVDFPESGLA